MKTKADIIIELVNFAHRIRKDMLETQEHMEELEAAVGKEAILDPDYSYLEGWANALGWVLEEFEKLMHHITGGGLHG